MSEERVAWSPRQRTIVASAIAGAVSGATWAVFESSMPEARHIRIGMVVLVGSVIGGIVGLLFRLSPRN